MLIEIAESPKDYGNDKKSVATASSGEFPVGKPYEIPNLDLPQTKAGVNNAGSEMPHAKPYETVPSDLPQTKCGPQEKCVTVEVDETKNKFERFLPAGEMDMEYLKTPFTRFLSGGEVLSQKGDRQVLSLPDGTSIEVNGNGTFAVRDHNGNKLPGEEMLIKPMPGYTPRGIFLSYGDRVTANVVDGTINFRTNSGASIDVDNRGFASITRQESLRFFGGTKR